MVLKQNFTNVSKTFGSLALALALCGSAGAQQFQASEFTPCPQGCPSVVLSDGSQFIAEGGTRAGHGLIFGVDPVGDQLAVPVISGLPTGMAADGIGYGPVALALDGDNLYIAIGEGDRFHNAGPLFRTTPAPFAGFVLQVSFSTDPVNAGPFSLTAANLQSLAAGQSVILNNLFGSVGNTATFRQVAALGSGAHPVGLALSSQAPSKLFVADSALNAVEQIDLTYASVTPFVQFAWGAQPESLRATNGGQLLVALTSPSPNGSSVQEIVPSTGGFQTLIGNLTSAVDAVPLSQPGQNTVFVLENSADPQGLGQVLVYNQINSGTVLVNGINNPTSVVLDQLAGGLLIYSRGDGIVYSSPLL